MRWTLVLGLFCLVGCAQVGTLSGGERDLSAPKPIAEKSEPANQTLNFSGSEIKLSFDEFVGLNKPNENLIVVPPNIKPKVVAKGKKVVISWEDTLLPNTTYAFYLNGLIKDVTEGNDSLMTFVFSTGSTLDSLEQTVRVTDAKSGKPLKRMVVGLYAAYADTLKPTYFAETNEDGFATVRYMRSGAYRVLSFMDVNRNLLVEPNEAIGFYGEEIEISQGNDTVGVRVFMPEKDQRISTFSFVPPNAFRVGATASIENSEFKVNGTVLDSSQIHWYAEDSLSFFLNTIDTNSFELTMSGAFVDTNRVRFRKQIAPAKLKLEMLTETKLKPGKSPMFWAPGEVTNVDESKCSLKFNKDSLSSAFEIVQPSGMTFELRPMELKAGRYVLQLLPQALTVSGQMNTDTLNFEWTVLSTEELGAIRVSCPGYESGLVLQVLYKGEVVNSAVLDEGKDVNFKQMLPGQYAFRLLVDENGNGKWDTGSLTESRQPERIIIFEKNYSLRANWDLEVELQKSDEPRE